MFRKKVYQWHRQLSVLIALPLLLWAGSGIMHPIMTNLKPNIATQSLKPTAIDGNKIKLNLQDLLKMHQIDSFSNVRFVHIDSNWFYQVQLGLDRSPLYFSTSTGKILKKGDWLYAQWLARQFLEGQKNVSPKNLSDAGIKQQEDCCDAATVCVLKNSKGSPIASATMLSAFNQQYKSVNRILPVWNVTFERSDSIRIYVETTQDRFVLGMDERREKFNNWFGMLHTWDWIEALGTAKWLVEIICCLLILTAVYFGLYIFFTSRHKNANGQSIQRHRKWHRLTGIAFSIFSIAFATSGALHCLTRFFPDHRANFADQHWFKTSEIRFSLPDILKANRGMPSNISLVHIGGLDYWRVLNQGTSPSNKMGTMHTPAATVKYFNTDHYQLLKDGDFCYARWLASRFSGQPEKALTPIAVLTKFSGAYGFANKRLPVVQVRLGSTNASDYYLETATGRLAAKLNLLDRVEAYSFAFLHKHEFLMPLGKSYKDYSTLFGAATQILLVLIGLMLFVRVKSRKGRKMGAV